MKIEQYLLRLFTWFGLIAASLTTMAELLSYSSLNLSIYINLVAISVLIAAIALIGIGKYNMAGILATLTLVGLMSVEMYLSEFPRQGSIAVFLVVGLSNSVIFPKKLRFMIHVICFSLLAGMLSFIYSTGYELPDDTSYVSMMFNILVMYLLIGFASYAIKNRYDQLINELNIFNDKLEAKVENRTKRLLHYSHKNSHEVRAPLTRILSLIELYKKDRSTRNDDYTIDILEQSATELDDIIKEVNLILNKEKED